jgi:hypothetical protein
MLARGDAGVARPDLHVASLVNPAELGTAWDGRVRVTVLGVSASGRLGRIRDAIEFYEDELDDVDNFTDEETRRVEARALDLFERPITLRASALLPSVAFRAGSVGISAGAYVTQVARKQAIAREPWSDVSVFAQMDGIFAVGAGMPIGDTGLRAGLTAKYVERYVSAYRRDVDLFDVPPVLFGSTVALDLGLQYDVAAVDGLTTGLTVHNLVGGSMTYDSDDFFGAFEETPEVGSEEIARRILDDVDGPALRLGAAYQIPRRFAGGRGVSTVLLDWVSASTTGETQSVLRRLRIGAETSVRMLSVRAGLGQGVPSAGLGLNLKVVHLDYAIYGRQEGTAPTDGASYAHVLQLRVGW